MINPVIFLAFMQKNSILFLIINKRAALPTSESYTSTIFVKHDFYLPPCAIKDISESSDNLKKEGMGLHASRICFYRNYLKNESVNWLQGKTRRRKSFDNV